MKYLEKSFSSRPSSKEYRDNYDRAFSKTTQNHQQDLTSLDEAEKFVNEVLPGLTRTEKRDAAEKIVKAFKNVKGFAKASK